MSCGGTVAPPGSTAAPTTQAASPDTARASASSTDNASMAGEPQPEPSTFHSLAVRWPIRGDANANASISVHYARRGDSKWSEALPLFRTNPSALSPENRVPNGWLFAGSIVDLSPDTEYQVALSLRDADGGDVQRIVTVRTAAEPKEPPGMRVRYVAPGGGAGESPGTGSADAPFRGLKVAQAAAEPGDLFLLRAGIYAEGTWTLDRFGTADRPIIYRGAGDGETVLDGGGSSRLVDANGLRHVWFERLTFRNARFLLVGHAGSNFVVRRSRFEVVQAGITAINGGYAESRGFVITDNVFQGPMRWPRRPNEDINGIIITGAGHVVAYNRIVNLADGVHGTANGRLSASDFHNNDVEASNDDGIETDNSDTNVRVFRNRITNAFSGIAAQPSNGGPVYVFRNAIYNAEYSPFKLHNDTSGVLIFHNTSVKIGIPFLIDPAGETVSDVVTRNNLFIGTSGPALFSTGRMIRCGFDSDGYGWLASPGPLQHLLSGFAQWNREVYTSPDSAKRSGHLYWAAGAIVMPSVGNFASGLRPPADLRVQYPTSGTDLRLAPASRAVDAGVRLPNLNDGFRGSAPDLGCCELGEPLPIYGPRP
jgi:hypothetical protein